MRRKWRKTKSSHQVGEDGGRLNLLSSRRTLESFKSFYKE